MAEPEDLELAKACFLCGHLIGNHVSPDSWSDDPESSWLNYFRLIYRAELGLEVLVSGVGVNEFDGDFSTFSAPEDFETRLSGRGDAHAVRMIQGGVWAREHVYGDGQEDEEGAIFIIHEVCWALLEKAHHPVPVPHRRLWEVLRSLTTFDNYLPCWGHDYGGLGVDFTTHDIYTWDRHERRNPDSYYWRIPNADPRAAAGHVARLLDATSSAAPPESKLPLTASSTGTDPFFRFPDEIRLEISSCLTVSEALHLRQASRAFCFVYYDNQFWASNFRQPDGDRAWFLGLMNRHDKEQMDWNLDWRSLYRQTHDTHLSPELKNGRRVWALAKRLRAVLDLGFPYSIPEYGGSCFAGRTLSCEDDNVSKELDDIEWKFQPAVGDFWNGDVWETNFDMHTLFVHVPDALSRLSFSFVPLGDCQYVAGMKIYTANTGQQFEFGYQAPVGRQRFVDIEGLNGFTVAMGSQGITAIQCMDARGVVGGWIGDPGFFPRTRRLAGRMGLGGQIVAMKAEFDGCRMTKLAVATSSTLNIHELPGIETDVSLRNHAFWHPGIPDESLFIHEQGLPSVTYFARKYRPIRWVHFGGPGGEYLRHITKMGVAVESIPFSFSFEFHYGGLSVPREHAGLSIGRSHFRKPTQLEEFPIDGSHGEVFEDIKVHVRICDKYGGPDGQGFEVLDLLSQRKILQRKGHAVAIEVKTNRGRSKMFASSTYAEQVPRTMMRSYSLISAGQGTITGLYAGYVGNSQWILCELLEQGAD